jgi:hypothetical protein
VPFFRHQSEIFLSSDPHHESSAHGHPAHGHAEEHDPDAHEAHGAPSDEHHHEAHGEHDPGAHEPHGAPSDEHHHEEEPHFEVIKDLHNAMGKHESHVQDHVAKVNSECPGGGSANSVAVGLMTAVFILPLIVYMVFSTSAEGRISALTIKAIDLTTSIFLAVLWFTATSEVLENKYLYEAFPYAEEVFAFLNLIVLYVLTMWVAYAFRENKIHLLTFAGVAGHYIAFAGIKAVGESQHMVSEMAPDHLSHWVTLAWCILVLLVLASLSIICFYSWRKKVEDKELHEAIEDLELDVVGLVLSFAIMQSLRHGLTGNYPSNAHLLQVDATLDGRLDACSKTIVVHGPHHRDHTQAQRTFMLLWSIGLTILACLILNPLQAIKHKHGYFVQKSIHVCQVVLVMCVAWGYLLWGEWQFYETLFHGDLMFGKMVFAVIATCLGLILIVALGFGSTGRFSLAKGYADLCVMAISLVVAWSWEHCFHQAINVIAHQYEVGYGGLVPKVVLALSVPFVILPGYLMYLKPIVISANERIDDEFMEAPVYHRSAGTTHSHDYHRMQTAPAFSSSAHTLQDESQASLSSQTA